MVELGHGYKEIYTRQFKVGYSERDISKHMRDNILRVAVLGGRVVGIMRTRNEKDNLVLGDLASIERGIGTALLNLLIAEADGLRKSIITTAWTDGLIPYYERFGFKQDPRERKGHLIRKVNK